ncbi:MAG TPA: hypothetical protein VH253_07930 [Phycisphaerae bacterium]|nr:hypothetical protein [Phycisphaerae bacterium]
MILGIFYGLGSAFTQSFSYLATRHFVQRRSARGMWDLLILGHLLMGVMGLVGCVCAWPAGAPGMGQWGIAWPLVGTSLFYLIGQAGLQYSLKHGEASRITPLLGFKVLLQAALVGMLGMPGGGEGAALTWLQWAAVGLCVAGGLLINASGGVFRRRAIAGVGWTVCFFALSDYHIAWLVKDPMRVPGLSATRAAILGASLQYAFNGAIALPFVGLVQSAKVKDWREALPFAATWFGAMLFLFGAIGQVGVILGTILQSTRGVITIILAAGIAWLGHEHIEPLHGRGIVLRRLAGGSLMFVAIALYVIKEPGNIKLGAGNSDQPPAERGASWSQRVTTFC